MRCLYLIGTPGSGKTTLMSRTMEGVGYRTETKPFAHRLYPGGVWLGGARGTDELSMSVQPAVLEYLEAERPASVVGEGDRLANAKFFEAVQEIGYELTVVLLNTPPLTAAARRERRGTNQDPNWLAGRETKIRRLRPWARVELDGRLPADFLAMQLAEYPAVRALQGKPVAEEGGEGSARGQGRLL